jgi:rubredoxin
MTKWLCTCGYIYDEEKGVPSKNIEPNTKVEDFSCPKCNETNNFEEVKKTESDEDVPTIKASYDRMKEWVMDPKGYFTIKPFPEENLIKVRYYTNDGKLQNVIEGKDAMEIYNTIIKEKMISSLQHAADMGAELMKAEVCMKLKKEYVQDGPLNLV